MNYNDLRHFADSWGLVFMGVTYLVLIGWHFRPGGKERSRNAAAIVFSEPHESKDKDHD